MRNPYIPIPIQEKYSISDNVKEGVRDVTPSQQKIKKPLYCLCIQLHF